MCGIFADVTSNIMIMFDDSDAGNVGNVPLIGRVLSPSAVTKLSSRVGSEAQVT